VKEFSVETKKQIEALIQEVEKFKV
jgi:hypothetical protein